MKRPSLALLLISSAVSLNASSLEERLDTLDQQMKEIRMRSVYGNYGARTATASPSLDRYGPSLSMEVLCWKPWVGGTEFAFFDDSFPVAAPYDGKTVQPNFDWQWGLRAELGYQFCNADWAITSEYSRIRFHEIKHADHPTFGLSASNLPGASNETSAQAKWNFSFNVLDVNLSKPYFLRPRLSISPQMGVRTAWIHQRDTAEYFNASNNHNSLLKFINNTTGAGILFGSALRWHWSDEWSLSSNWIGSLIYGKMKVHAKSMNFNFSPAVPLLVSANLYKVLPNISIDTALQWEMAWRAVRLSLSLGYEFQYWWRQNQRMHLDIDTAYSWVRLAEDIGFHGTKLKAGIDF